MVHPAGVYRRNRTVLAGPSKLSPDHMAFHEPARQRVNRSNLQNCAVSEKTACLCRSFSAKTNTNLAFGLCEVAILFQLFKIGFCFGLQG
jgi:hypothetical protein